MLTSLFRRKKYIVEHGQTMVEFVLVLPIFLALLFGIIQLSWVGFQIASVNYNLNLASWEISEEQIDSIPSGSNTATRNEYCRQFIIQNISETNAGLVMENLRVENPSLTVKSLNPPINVWTSTSDESSQYSINEKTYDIKTMNISCDISYDIDLIIGESFGFEPITYTRHIDKELTIEKMYDIH